MVSTLSMVSFAQVFESFLRIFETMCLFRLDVRQAGLGAGLVRRQPWSAGLAAERFGTRPGWPDWLPNGSA
jgi:hypothetical protein